MNKFVKKGLENFSILIFCVASEICDVARWLHLVSQKGSVKAAKQHKLEMQEIFDRKFEEYEQEEHAEFVKENWQKKRDIDHEWSKKIEKKLWKN